MHRQLVTVAITVSLVSLVAGFFGGYSYKNFTAEEQTPTPSLETSTPNTTSQKLAVDATMGVFSRLVAIQMLKDEGLPVSETAVLSSWLNHLAPKAQAQTNGGGCTTLEQSILDAAMGQAFAYEKFLWDLKTNDNDPLCQRVIVAMTVTGQVYKNQSNPYNGKGEYAVKITLKGKVTTETLIPDFTGKVRCRHLTFTTSVDQTLIFGYTKGAGTFLTLAEDLGPDWGLTRCKKIEHWTYTNPPLPLKEENCPFCNKPASTPIIPGR